MDDDLEILLLVLPREDFVPGRGNFPATVAVSDHVITVVGLDVDFVARGDAAVSVLPQDAKLLEGSVVVLARHEVPATALNGLKIATRPGVGGDVDERTRAQGAAAEVEDGEAFRVPNPVADLGRGRELKAGRGSIILRCKVVLSVIRDERNAVLGERPVPAVLVVVDAAPCGRRWDDEARERDNRDNLSQSSQPPFLSQRTTVYKPRFSHFVSHEMSPSWRLWDRSCASERLAPLPLAPPGRSRPHRARLPLQRPGWSSQPGGGGCCKIQFSWDTFGTQGTCCFRLHLNARRTSLFCTQLFQLFQLLSNFCRDSAENWDFQFQRAELIQVGRIDSAHKEEELLPLHTT